MRRNRTNGWLVSLMIVGCGIVVFLPTGLLWAQSPKPDVRAKAADRTWKTTDQKPDPDGWRPLLPSKGLAGWELTDFGTDAKVHRDGDILIIEMGDPLNGITYQGDDFPKENFEIYLEANRLEGNDFFCGLTFPVGDGFATFVVGGWGGSLVGLSSVDGFDASENATTTAGTFKNGQWYRMKVRVDDEYVRAWIDDEEYFRQERNGHEFSTRIEVYASQPLGICAYMTKAAIRNFKWRPLPANDSDKQRTPEKSDQ